MMRPKLGALGAMALDVALHNVALQETLDVAWGAVLNMGFAGVVMG